MPVDELTWRTMRDIDIDDVVTIAAASFPCHFEDRGCFEERLVLYPQGCFVLASSIEVKGYLIAYPYPFGTMPPLNSLLRSLPKTSDALYLHDLALHPDVRGRGHAAPAIEHLVNAARVLAVRSIHLVAVNNSMPFWQTMSFTAVPSDPVITEKLRTYGEDAAYMVRKP